MLAEVCSFYGWTVDTCLDMLAKQFFIMLKKSRELNLINKIELCDIQAISVCDAKYYEKLRGKFERDLKYLLDDIKELKKHNPAKPVLDAASQETRYLLQEIFTRNKSVH